MEKEILPNTKTEPKEQAEQSAELILLDPEKGHFTRESSGYLSLAYDGKTYDTGNDASSNPAVLAMREQVREQLNVSQDTFRYDYFAYLQRRGILNPDE